MGDIRIRVGVALDSNVKSVYRPYVLAAQEAAQQVMRALNAGHQASLAQTRKTVSVMPEVLAGPYRTAGKRIDDELKKITKAEEREVNRRKSAAEREQREKERAYQKMVRELERAEEQKTRIVERELAKQSRAEERERARNARRTAYWSMRNFAPVTPTLSMGRRMASDVARGAGVETNMGAMVSDYVGREKLATQLTSGAWVGGFGNKDIALNGSDVRIDPKQLMREANEVALATGMEGGSTALLQGLQEFVAKTGDLKTARDLMRDLSVFSKATGTSMDDALSAAADMANSMPDGIDKAKSIMNTMRALGGQGQVGAVEIRHLSQSMGKLAGQSTNFTLEGSTKKTLEGVGMTDKVSQNLAIMGALTQAARARGGRTTATLATNSAMAFIQDMSNQTLMKRWGAAGMNTFADKDKTQIRDPKALILEVMNKTHGNLGEITRLMPNKNSRSVLQAFAKDYQQGVNEATKANPQLDAKGKNLAGLAQVSKAFDAYLKVTMSGEEIQKKFGIAMETNASKSAVFNQRMQMLADNTTEKLLPALQKLSPLIERGAQAFGDFLVWATDHPGKAVAIALSASITKAAIENTIRAGIENLMKGTAGNTAMGKLGSMFTIAAAAITIAEVGKLYIDKVFKDESDEQRRRAEAAAAGGADATIALSRGTITGEDRARLESELVKLRAQKANLDANPDGQSTSDRLAGGLLEVAGIFSKDAEAAAKEASANYARENERQTKETVDSIRRLEAVLTGIQNGTIKVEVTNQPKAPHEGTAPVGAKVGP